MNKKIVLVENSKMYSRLICDSISSSEKEVVCFKDGKEALNYILTNDVNCVVANNFLPNIDGIQLSSIIKEGSVKSNLPFIIYNVDNDRPDFDAITSKIRYLHLSKNNLQELINLVEEVLKNDEEGILQELENTDSAPETFTDPLLCSVRAMDSKLSKLSIYKKILDLEQYSQDVDTLARKILSSIYSFCHYDCCSLIFGKKPAHIYYAISPKCSEQYSETFLKICKSDFETKMGLSNGIDYENSMKDCVQDDGDELADENDVNEVLKSIRAFEISDGELLGTLHVASFKRRFFNYKVISSLELFLNKLGSLISHSINYQNIALAKNRMYSAFTKFVPEEVIEDMIKNDDSKEQTQTEKRKVAIMICDIRSFTTISEINEPEDVVGFLNGYFTKMVDVIKQKGGSIDKFMGDAIMANFGAPISYSDNAKRAVEAAMEMINVLDDVPVDMLKFNEKVSSINIGVGIHYGEVIVGNIGCKDKTDYTVIGDSANLASRLEGLTKQYGANIIVSKDVIDDIEDSVKKDSKGNEYKESVRKEKAQELLDSYNIVKLDKVKVKGKHQGIEIFGVNYKNFSPQYKADYEKGLSLYLNGNFGFAQEYFEKARACVDNDKATELMIGICKEYKENPPEDWDGGRELTSK